MPIFPRPNWYGQHQGSFRFGILAYNNGNLNLIIGLTDGYKLGWRAMFLELPKTGKLSVCFERSSIWICLSENTTNNNHKQIRLAKLFRFKEDLLQYEDFPVVANFDH
ncbi:hypothetical protein K435DRAFT_797934 [Dendrothele bispora CBS 962.96]|uniref:Uncharacterized protein n=1 Tax=Dendrothele bispora (strain CBS 962.96) TaxID=1314807 RepID=A0A4S8M0Y2_DENBC|nr:hypothetical protein K435DRAFT_797934 [Dendrothele bispora CBS 962.96]